MKKEDVSGVIAYLLILVLAVVFGFAYLKNQQQYFVTTNLPFIVFIILAIVVGVIFNATLFELGHIAGAKKGGYKIISTCILGFTWFKDEQNKTKFKLGSYDGLTGETKIIPNCEQSAKDGKLKEANPTPYLWFGTLFYVVELVLVLATVVIMGDKMKDLTTTQETLKNNLGIISTFVLVVGVIGFMILIYNILPFKLDSTTDGYRMTLVANPKNKAAFNELLRVEHEIELGHTDVDIKVFDEITNFTADLNLNKVYVSLDKKDYETAETLLDQIINSKESISEKVYLRAKAQKICLYLMNKPLEEAEAYYKESVSMSEVREFSNDISMASVRVYLLISGLLDKSRSECLFAINHVNKAYKSTPKNRRNVEVDLFNSALDKVIAAHPSWELENYKFLVQK